MIVKDTCIGSTEWLYYSGILKLAQVLKSHFTPIQLFWFLPINNFSVINSCSDYWWSFYILDFQLSWLSIYFQKSYVHIKRAPEKGFLNQIEARILSSEVCAKEKKQRNWFCQDLANTTQVIHTLAQNLNGWWQ